MAQPGDRGFCTTKCTYKDTATGWVCDTHVCVEEGVLSVTVQESGASSRIINIPLKKGTTVNTGGALVQFTTSAGTTDDLNDIAISGGILPSDYKITVNSDRKLNIFLKSDPAKPIVEYIKGLSGTAKPANNSARKNAEDAKAALKEAQSKLEAAQKESADARVAAAAAQAEAAAATAAQAALTTNVAGLRSNVATAQTARSEAQIRAATAEAALTPIQARLTAIEGAYDAAQAAEARARQELASANLAHARDLAASRDELNRALIESRTALATNQETLAAEQENVRRLTTELAAAPTAAAKATVDAQLVAATNEITRLSARIGEQQADIGRHTEELRTVRAEADTARDAAAAELTRTREDASRSVQACMDALRDSRTGRAAVDADVLRITAERERLEAELAAARTSATTSASEQLAVFERQIRTVDAALHAASARADAALAQERSVHASLTQTQRDSGERIVAAERAVRDQMAVLSAEKGRAEGLSEEKQRTIDRLTADLTAARAREAAAIESEQGTNEDIMRLQERIRREQTAAETARAAAQERAAAATQQERTSILADAAGRADASRVEIQGLNMQLQRLIEERTAATTNLAAARTDVQRLIAQVSTAEATIGRLQEEATARITELATARSDLTTAQARVQQLQSEMAAASAAGTSGADTLRQELTAARSEAATKTGQLLDQMERIATLERESGASGEKERRITEYLEEITRLHALVSSTRAQQEAATASIDQIRHEQLNVEREFQERERQAAAAAQEASTRAAAATGEGRAEILALIASIAAGHNTNIRSYHDALLDSQARLIDAERRFAEANAASAEHVRRSIEMADEIEQLRSRIAVVAVDCTEVSRRLEECERRVANVSNLEHQLNRSINENTRLSESVKGLASENKLLKSLLTPEKVIAFTAARDASAASDAPAPATAALAASAPAAAASAAPAASVATTRELNRLRDENNSIKDQLMPIVTILNERGAYISTDKGATITMMIAGILAYLTSHPPSSGGRYTPINIHKIKIKTKKHRQKSTRYTVRKQQI